MSLRIRAVSTGPEDVIFDLPELFELKKPHCRLEFHQVKTF
jgi:hypothetical protein